MGQVKGSQIIDVVRTLRANRAACEPLLGLHLKQYLSERVVVGAWYPDEHHRDLLFALGQFLRPRVPGDVWRFIGDEGAKTDLNGTYASIVRPKDPAGTLTRSAGLWPIYHDSGHLMIRLSGPRSARMTIQNFETMCPELAGVIAGYDTRLLLIGGASEASMEVVECQVGESAVWLATWQ